MAQDMAGDSIAINRRYLDRLVVEGRIVGAVHPDARFTMFGRTFDTPITTGALSHLKAGMPALAEGAKLAGALCSIGMGSVEEMEAVFEPMVRMEEEMRAVERQMAEAVDDELLLKRLGGRYDQLTRDFERGNGYGWRSAVQGVLAGLGFRKEQQQQRASVLSGGERTRLCLGRMLLSEPDLLLLDEPTNHLDLKSIAWLESYLADYRGAVLIISHDRYFMDHVCDHMAELLFGRIETYDGNYTDYMKQEIYCHFYIA